MPARGGIGAGRRGAVLRDGALGLGPAVGSANLARAMHGGAVPDKP